MRQICKFTMDQLKKVVENGNSGETEGGNFLTFLFQDRTETFLSVT